MAYQRHEMSVMLFSTEDDVFADDVDVTSDNDNEWDGDYKYDDDDDVSSDW